MKRIYIKSCDRRNPFKKCSGDVFRIPYKNINKNFEKDFQIAYVEVCSKCDALHKIWRKGELEELETQSHGEGEKMKSEIEFIQDLHTELHNHCYNSEPDEVTDRERFILKVVKDRLRVCSQTTGLKSKVVKE